MEDIKNNKLNIDLDNLPRKKDGSLDLEKIATGRDEKGYIIPDIVFDTFLKELPEGTTNETGNFRAYNGGKLARLENNREEASRRGIIGAEASNNSQATRRTSRQILEDIATKKANRETIERLGLAEGTSNLEALNYAQYIKAQQGDTKAAEYVRDTMGEKPTTEINADITAVTPEDQELMRRVAARLKADNS
jgi:hypothetical protein